MDSVYSSQKADLARARREANKLTTRYSYPPIPVWEIAEQNGVNVVFVTFGDYSDKVAGYCNFKNAELFVNSEDDPIQQLFTMAHELGHWLLHREIFKDNEDDYPILLRSHSQFTNNQYEKEANTFASHLLVPERLLIPVLSPTADAVRLANIFFVSAILMELRIRNR